MSIDVTLQFFFFTFTLSSALFVYCMVVRRGARSAVPRLPGILLKFLSTRKSSTTPVIKISRGTGASALRLVSTNSSIGQLYSKAPTQFRQLSTRPYQSYTQQRQRLINSSAMFKKAVENHNMVSSQKATASLQLFFSSSPPVPQARAISPPQSSRPLERGAGNTLKAQGRQRDGYGAPMQHAGIKRSASGLAKALAPDNAFEDTLYPDLSATNKSSADVYFDENDFDSDIDLDIEDPMTKGQVKYPNLPPPTVPASRSNLKPTEPRQASVSTTNGSGYNTQYPHQQLEALHSDDLLPWSSSPISHFKTPPGAKKPPIWHKYANPNGAPPSNLQETHEQPRPSKRRTLPWLQQKAEEESEPPARATASTPSAFSKTQNAYTPLPKNNKKTAHPWNITASAIKEQQKQLRQNNKKLIKTNEATEEERKLAIVKKKKAQVHKVFLSDEQQHVLNLVVDQKKSVFFTGSAGTGKSVLLREIISSLRRKYHREMDRIAVTASTGLAACNVGGVTLHSFAGIGLGKEEVPELVKKIRRNQKAKHRWMRTKVLIIDEVSMVDGELFDKLEEIARRLRNNGRPFGGIQLVITGDFFQLPPVPDQRRPDGSKRDSQFAFEAPTWNTCIEHTIGLHHVFRQKDPEFANMLNEMREGRLSQQSIARFKSLNRDLRFEDEIDATELFPTRAEVDGANSKRMRNLQGEAHTFEARDGGTISDKVQRDRLLANCMATESLMLKKGSQVMLIKNVDETLVNGSLGKVIGFMSEQQFDHYDNNEEEYYAVQATLGENGENEDEIPGLAEKRKKMQDLIASTTQRYPVVRFTIADGTTRDLLCQREKWKIELPNGEVQAERNQIPLILAWALSIHKAQGQTLERVKVDLGKVFEKGQAYVALSRAVSMQGLQVMNFSASKVMAHERVRIFYNGLSRAEELSGGNSKGKGGGLDSEKAKKARVNKAEDYERQFLNGDDHWEV